MSKNRINRLLLFINFNNFSLGNLQKFYISIYAIKIYNFNIIYYCFTSMEVRGTDYGNAVAVQPSIETAADLNLVWHMIRSHKFHTGSPLGDRILNAWECSSKNRFVEITPKAMDAVDVDQIYSQQISMLLSDIETKKR